MARPSRCGGMAPAWRNARPSSAGSAGSAAIRATRETTASANGCVSQAIFGLQPQPCPDAVLGPPRLSSRFCAVVTVGVFPATAGAVREALARACGCTVWFRFGGFQKGSRYERRSVRDSHGWLAVNAKMGMLPTGSVETVRSKAST